MDARTGSVCESARWQLLVGDSIDEQAAWRLWDFQRGTSAETMSEFNVPEVAKSPFALAKNMGAPVMANSPEGNVVRIFNKLPDVRFHEWHLPSLDQIHLISLSHDGQQLAVWGKQGGVGRGGVIETDSGEWVRHFPTMADQQVAAMHFLNEQCVLILFRDHLSRIIDLETGTERPLPYIGSRGEAAVSSAGDLLVFGDRKGHLRMLPLATPTEQGLSHSRETGAFPLPAQLSGQGELIAGLSGNVASPYECVLWNHRRREVIDRLQGLPLWMAPDGKTICLLRFTTRNPEALAVGKAPLITATGFERWHVTHGSVEKVSQTNINPPLTISASMAFPSGTRSVFGTVNGQVFLADHERGVLTDLGDLSPSLIAGFGISTDERYLAIAGETSLLYDLHQTRMVKTLERSLAAICNRIFTPDSRYLIHADDSGALYVHDLNEPEKGPRILQGHLAAVQRMAISHDGNTLATRDREGHVKLWHLPTWSKIMELQSNGFLAFTQDGQSLVTDGGLSPDKGISGRLTIRSAASLEEIDASIGR